MNEYDALLRIDAVLTAIRATPAKRPHGIQAVVRAKPLEDGEAQPEAFTTCGIQRTGLVRRHQCDGLRSQNPHTVELTSIEEHLEKARVVPRGGYQPRASRKAAARPFGVVPLPLRPVGCASDVIRRVARVHRDEAVALRRGDEEVGVV